MIAIEMGMGLEIGIESKVLRITRPFIDTSSEWREWLFTIHTTSHHHITAIVHSEATWLLITVVQNVGSRVGHVQLDTLPRYAVLTGHTRRSLFGPDSILNPDTHPLPKQHNV